MGNKEPTKEQVKELWERCGAPTLLDDMEGGRRQLDVDLNNLFEHAVPFLLEKHTLIESYSFKQEGGLYYSETTIWDRDERQLKGKLVGKAFAQGSDLEKVNALALFWALWQAEEDGKGQSSKQI